MLQGIYEVLSRQKFLTSYFSGLLSMNGIPISVTLKIEYSEPHYPCYFRFRGQVRQKKVVKRTAVMVPGTFHTEDRKPVKFHPQVRSHLEYSQIIFRYTRKVDRIATENVQRPFISKILISSNNPHERSRCVLPGL